MFAKKRYAEKAQMKKTLVPCSILPIFVFFCFYVNDGAVPAYLLDRDATTRAKWKRMITKVTFVGRGSTRKPPKYEHFIRLSGLRFTKAHVTHLELKCTFNLKIIGVKRNPNGTMYTSLGVITKGTIIVVNVSELGLVTLAGKVVWGKISIIF
ncbi:putative ribosomal protein S8e/ribosomal biogenesis NSA2 [Helianthus annuus]|uniref:Ribosomal protein S8e/ribosomal biogenesis NSA2 n=2 Tax=Helianthus annuus TaxID=4232 RepID=A0A9K3JFT7_HELAN|nr:putative ribosomal protein S8e/ribosomal biogenesis NSA2 [Helianthus annuus]KAJ0592854.1 putative ribosomal protein S8e/ribosomal biogenesis NSA2 [Helianthus annuus]KAJ0600537.1 putative ribosomal protein S8e/ribosomal biogenesis NSA2 [Helianthus annuus]KAJ0607856.1 putative ribosomal protein S8e/ribosomal biogenesis NSA2 [Helianthus annuus]KAJ0767920.1 putative ribosomal protein S8e/ribosomal biogenesis NSA2 [Helianthus annuus]